ncbi:helix-turn-helix domain-containing protein [Bradyrhizobium sp. dw_78]|uniref:winged helix-turn-helix transcriptional regulator n=1 Tax=Bradyrhizobium sp. dw_78 TaxID=2719793 RepID=UPI001BD1E311|nr:helix-turn-helix domain-containing protein [Bradyrhizobium sp. dw_78]
MELTVAEGSRTNCRGVSEVLNRVGDKWTVQVVVALHERPQRFNEIKRGVNGISQQMLIKTLKTLERDGMVERTVRSSTPPQVQYALTSLGCSLAEPVRHLAEWALAHLGAIHDSQVRFDEGITRKIGG